ncbi:hypothetical protein FF38_00348 [Lucilia cuprina]|uniref:Uncharacterized protein n=1 Tax=Lucilia cuprina TaxID=7375 RepID=A0A0L0CB42_LUCCU|nr:hypothetical protein FF38_00348 [Lucilia cuprina]
MVEEMGMLPYRGYEHAIVNICATTLPHANCPLLKNDAGINEDKQIIDVENSKILVYEEPKMTALSVKLLIILVQLSVIGQLNSSYK